MTAKEILQASQIETITSLAAVRGQKNVRDMVNLVLDVVDRQTTAIGAALDALLETEIEESTVREADLEKRLQAAEEELAEARHASSTAQGEVS